MTLTNLGGFHLGQQRDGEAWAYYLGTLDGWRNRWGRSVGPELLENDRLRLAYWFGYAETRR